jgi:hypothetical protein
MDKKNGSAAPERGGPMTEVRCPWEECNWNIATTCTRHLIILMNRYDPDNLNCGSYDAPEKEEGKLDA